MVGLGLGEESQFGEVSFGGKGVPVWGGLVWEALVWRGVPVWGRGLHLGLRFGAVAV